MQTTLGTSLFRDGLRSGILFRFKDGDIVITDTTSGQSSYTFTDLSKDDAGVYKCRANNDYSAIVSEEVVVAIEGNITHNQ